MNQLIQNITNIHGEKGKKWFSDLPEIVNQLRTHWQLTNLVPVDNMTFNYVVKATSKNNQAVILKISCDEKSIIDEMKALKYFNGKGSVELIDYNSQYHALLLHQAVPGVTLKSFYPSQIEFVMDCYVNTMRKLHSQPLTNKHHYPHISHWLSAIDKITPKQLPEALLKKSIILKNNLLNTMNREVFLHGDLHHDNILQDGNTWLAIDPKGVVGEPEFEIAAFDFIHPSEVEKNGDIKKLFETRVKLISEKSNLHFQRIHDWVFVRLILGAAWSIEDNSDLSWFVKLAETLVESN